MTNPLLDFAKNEARLSRLYRSYADRFVAQKDLWLGLAQEEKVHAALLRGLNRRFAGDKNLFVVSRAGRQILDYIADFIVEQQNLALGGLIASEEAVKIALRLEQSMLEKKSFEIFATDHEEVHSVLARLNKETDEHRRRLEKAQTRFFPRDETDKLEVDRE